jgi:diguanylate cyclase
MYGLVFIVASICVCIGFGVAVLIERKIRPHSAPSKKAKKADRPATEMNADIGSELVQELLKSLQNLTQDVSSNVDRHSSRVAKISESYDLNTVTDPTTVVKAAKLLIEANKELQHDLHSAREEIRVQKEQMRSYMTQARTDELTGLPNRRVFEQELRRHSEDGEYVNLPLSLILLDVDHFKRFNDYHGHQTGDVVLKAVAQILEESIGELDIVCRYGGEEFSALLPGVTLEEGQFSAERIRNAVANNTVTVDGSELRVTISAGIAQALDDEDPKSLVKRADEALYAAKNAGRNFTAFHDGSATRLLNADAFSVKTGW